jgi:hypothetical protein
MLNEKEMTTSPRNTKTEKQPPDVLLTVIPKKISVENSQDNKRKIWG